MCRIVMLPLPPYIAEVYIITITYLISNIYLYAFLSPLIEPRSCPVPGSVGPWWRLICGGYAHYPTSYLHCYEMGLYTAQRPTSKANTCSYSFPPRNVRTHPVAKNSKVHLLTSLTGLLAGNHRRFNKKNKHIWPQKCLHRAREKSITMVLQ